MDWWTLHQTLHGILSHPLTSMILFKIDAQRIAIFPLECDAPRIVDVHTVTLQHPLQAMEIESRHIDVCQRLCLIQRFQAAQTACMQLLPYSTAAATFE